MGSMNKAILIGNIGRDAEVRHTQGGDAVATLSLATSESWTSKKSGQREEQTEWHRVVIWGKTAENLSKYLMKGKQIAVEGRIQTRKWKDKDGNERYTTEIRADRVTLLGGGEGRVGRNQAPDDDTYDGRETRGEPEPEPATGVGPADDDVPF